MNTTICPTCQHEITLGQYPFCPHGGTRVTAIVGDAMDYIDHNLGPEPIHITSRAQRAAIMKERGLREAIWHIPEPGKDTSPVTRSWDTPCAYTLEQARILVSRQAEPSDPDAGRLETLQITWSPGVGGVGGRSHG